MIWKDEKAQAAVNWELSRLLDELSSTHMERIDRYGHGSAWKNYISIRVVQAMIRERIRP